jgi:hypothetical protein
MKINKNSWHFKLYTFSEYLIGCFFDDLDYRKRQINNMQFVDLCSYMRSILLWLPVRIGIYLFFFAWVYYVLIHQIFYTGGLSLLFYVPFILALFIGVLYGYLIKYLKNRKVESEIIDVTPKESNTFRSLFNFYKEVKNKYCPIMEISNDK